MNPRSHRRQFLKWVAAAPVLGTVAARGFTGRVSAALGKESTADVYRRSE